MFSTIIVCSVFIAISLKGKIKSTNKECPEKQLLSILGGDKDNFWVVPIVK